VISVFYPRGSTLAATSVAREDWGALAPTPRGEPKDQVRPLSSFAHPHKPFLIHLNQGWRVIEDSLQ
jgi:hypothetical protein